MPTFPANPPVPHINPGPGRFPDPPPAPPPGGFPRPPGPRTISFTQQRPGGNLTIDALMARQKAAALGQQQALATPQATIPGGLGSMLTSFLEGRKQYQAEQEEATGREEITQAMLGIDPTTGIATPEQLATIMRRDPDLGLALYQEAMEVRRQAAKDAAKAAEEGAPKYTEVASMADDFRNTPDVKKLENAQSMWVSLQDAATRDTAQADLNMVIALAKLFDPDSVVRTEEGEMVRDTGGLPQGLYGQFLKLTGTAGARLDRTTRQGMMQEAYSRMNGYYQGVQAASKHYSEAAKRWGFLPEDVVRPFAAPQPFDPEKVVGSDTVETPETPETPQNDSEAETTEPEGTIGMGEDGKERIVKNGRWVLLVR